MMNSPAATASPAQDFAENDLLSPPRSLHRIALTFTNRCNLRCVYCTEGTHGEDYYADVSPEFMERVYSIIENFGVREVWLGFYGEFTFQPDWWRYSNRIADMGCQLTGVSNFARMFTPDEIAAFGRFRTITMSIDTHDYATLKAVRKAADIRTILYNMQAIRSHCLQADWPAPTILWSSVLSDRVVGQMKAFISFASVCGVQQINFNHLADYVGAADVCRNICELEGIEFVHAINSIHQAIDFAGKHQIRISIKGLDKIQKKIERYNSGTAEQFQLERNIGVHGVEEVIKAFESDAIPDGHTRACLSPWSEIYLDPKGNVLPCCVRGDPMGVITSAADLPGILNNQKYRALRQALVTGEGLDSGCRHCTLNGITPVAALRQRVAEFVASRG